MKKKLKMNFFIKKAREEESFKMKKIYLLKSLFIFGCFVLVGRASYSAVTSGCNVTDPAVLIQQVKTGKHPEFAAKVGNDIYLACGYDGIWRL